MVNSIFFQLFPETKFSIQLSLCQFLFEVYRVSFHGEIFKKLFASHRASEADSTHTSEKSCFPLREKTHWQTFMSSFSDVHRVSTPGGFPH